MSNEEIQQQVLELFDRLVADLPHPQYLEVVENLGKYPLAVGTPHG